MGKFREIAIEGLYLILGKDEKSNDELMNQFKGKDNVILHTVSPGSPFCVVENKLKPTRSELVLSGSVCLGYSQDWRDNKSDSYLSVFTGKDISKPRSAKAGTWKVKKSKKILIKREDVIKSKKLIK